MGRETRNFRQSKRAGYTGAQTRGFAGINRDGYWGKIINFFKKGGYYSVKQNDKLN